MPSMGGRGRGGGDDVSGGFSGGSGFGGTSRDRDSSGPSEVERQNRASRQREKAQRAAQSGAPQFGQRGYSRSIGQYRGDPTRGFVDPETGRPTRSLTMKEEAEQRGWPSTLAAHLMGIVPGMDVEAREFVAQPGRPAGPAPSATTFGAGRLAGDIIGLGLGVPGLGDLAQSGYEAIGGGEGDVGGIDMASLLTDVGGAPTGALGAAPRRDGGDGGGFIPFPQVAAAPIAPAPPPTEAERLALARALMGGAGYTRAGQGILNTG